MKYEELSKLVCQWAKDKGIQDKATPLTQWDKMLEEVIETRDALIDQVSMLPRPETDEAITDGIGDVFVTLIILSLLTHRDPVKCLEHSYNEIKGRKGKMIEGVFVKEDSK